MVLINIRNQQFSKLKRYLSKVTFEIANSIKTIQILIKITQPYLK